MSFSNTSTGDKPADPYKKANEDQPDLQTKVNELVDFITKAKFGMMTTHESATDNLVSRCMALAATVCTTVFYKYDPLLIAARRQTALTYYFIRTPSLEKRTTSRATPMSTFHS